MQQHHAKRRFKKSMLPRRQAPPPLSAHTKTGKKSTIFLIESITIGWVIRAMYGTVFIGIISVLMRRSLPLR